MENMSVYNKYIITILNKILNFFNLEIDDFIYIVLYLFFIIFIKYSNNYLKKLIKYWLFQNRINTFLKFLYFRVDKILKPFILLLYIFFLKEIVLIIFHFKDDENLGIIFFFINLTLILWLIYEIIKFLIYSSINSKIKSQKNARRELFNLLLNISKILIAITAVVAILTRFNINITALITSLGIGGIIIGFAAKDVLVNFFDSIRLISEDAFRQGDWIETKDIEGFVTELGLTSTQIRTFDNAMVTIPNSHLANGYIKNWTKRLVGRRIKFKIPIKYTSKTDEIKRVVKDIYNLLHSHPDIVNLDKIKYLTKMKLTYEDGLFNIEDKYGVRRTLLVYLDDMGEYSLNILVYAFTVSVNWEDWLKAKQDIIIKIISLIEDSELEFAYPTQEVFVENRV